MGVGSDHVSRALTHIGAQGALKSSTTIGDAKKILSKLETSGAITDSSRAREVMRKAERVAAVADRMQQQQVKEQRLAEYDATRQALGSTFGQSGNQSVVREQAHGISIGGDSARGGHGVSIADALKKSTTNKTNGTGAAPVRPVLDIPFD